jgi:hypothetical protein
MTAEDQGVVGGGLDGAWAGSVHPVLQKAVDYWWRVIPRSVLGALLFALWTAMSVPLDLVHTFPWLTRRRRDLGENVHERSPTAALARLGRPLMHILRHG